MPACSRREVKRARWSAFPQSLSFTYVSVFAFWQIFLLLWIKCSASSPLYKLQVDLRDKRKKRWWHPPFTSLQLNVSLLSLTLQAETYVKKSRAWGLLVFELHLNERIHRYIQYFKWAGMHQYAVPLGVSGPPVLSMSECLLAIHYIRVHYVTHASLFSHRPCDAHLFVLTERERLMSATSMR